MVLNEDNTKADLDAWVTLDNSSGASYKNAKLKLIAGQVHRAQAPGRAMMAYDMVASRAVAAPEKTFEEQSFFEYHLYTLQRPTDVLNAQTKQVSLFPSTTAGTKKVYTYDPTVNDKKIGVSAEFDNTEANGLGMPLPAGRVRLYQRSSDGSQEFIGEDNIDHTPHNEKVTVRIGDAFDIGVERTQKDLRHISAFVTEVDWEVKLRNHKKDPIEIVVVDHPGGDWDVIRESLPHKKISSTKIEFHVTCEPEQEVVVTYTIRSS
jgi:hypothetical protein